MTEAFSTLPGAGNEFSLFVNRLGQWSKVSLCPDLELFKPLNFIAQQSIQLCLWEGLGPLKFIWYWDSRGIHKLSTHWLLHHRNPKNWFLRESVNRWMLTIWCPLRILSLPWSHLRSKAGFSGRGLARSGALHVVRNQSRPAWDPGSWPPWDHVWPSMNKGNTNLKNISMWGDWKPAFKDTFRKQKVFCYGCSALATWDKGVNKN